MRSAAQAALVSEEGPSARADTPLPRSRSDDAGQEVLLDGSLPVEVDGGIDLALRVHLERTELRPAAFTQTVGRHPLPRAVL